MNYAMVVLDLDDTLLRDDLTISERTQASLLKAQQKGVRVVLASGRPTSSMRRYAEELELSRFGGFLISFNGAVITDCATGETIFQKSLSRLQMGEIHDLALAHGAGILGYHNDRIVTPKKNPWTAVESKLTGLSVEEVADFKGLIDESSVKVIVLDEPERLAALSETLRPQVAGHMNMSLSKPFFLEFTDQGINKRESLAVLCERLEILPAAVMAVGDSYNDIGMLEFAGLAVCMGNGRDEVKAVADFVTASNLEDGVAVAVEKCVL